MIFGEQIDLNEFSFCDRIVICLYGNFAMDVPSRWMHSQMLWKKKTKESVSLTTNQQNRNRS